MRRITVGTNDEGRRMDAFLQRLMPSAPKSLIYKYIRTNKVKLCGKKPKPETRVTAGDEICYYGDETLLFLSAPTSGVWQARAHGKLPIVLYEDKNIVLLYKPAGIACQPDRVRKDGTLVDQLKWYLFQEGAFVPQAAHGFAPALCNRLDVNTHGIVIAAKTLPALRSMNEMIRRGKVRKQYLCRVEGVPKPPEGILITRLAKDRARNISHASADTGKEAKTHYRVMESDGKTSLVEVTLFSGRSHQIRVHMQLIGCPITGDPKYGGGKGGQELCAYKLIFLIPKSDPVLGYLAGKTFVLDEKGKLPGIREETFNM